MLLNIILLCIVSIAILILLKQIKRTTTTIPAIIPSCEFTITAPHFEIRPPVRIARYEVKAKGKNRYFREFPVCFRFFSGEKFKSIIKITYTVFGDSVKELIYNSEVYFDDHAKEHIYYIDNIILGSINIEIYTESEYGKPTIQFELLQGNVCHMEKEHKIMIKFPE